MAVGILEVLLLNAKGLGDSDFFGDMDPYVIVKYKSQERKSSVARGRGYIHPGEGGHPVWNERVRFRVECPGQGGSSEYKLGLRVMDKDTFSSDDFIGEATIYVKDLLRLGVENGTCELHPTKYRVIKPDQSYGGEILVGVTFTLKEEEVIDGEEEYGGWKEGSF